MKFFIFIFLEKCQDYKKELNTDFKEILRYYD